MKLLHCKAFQRQLAYVNIKICKREHLLESELRNKEYGCAGKWMAETWNSNSNTRKIENVEKHTDRWVYATLILKKIFQIIL